MSDFGCGNRGIFNRVRMTLGGLLARGGLGLAFLLAGVLLVVPAESEARPAKKAAAVAAETASPVSDDPGKPPQLAARAWVLVDAYSGQTLVAEKPEQTIEPASLTKLMTAYLTFAAVRDGKLKLNQAVPVSEKAWKASGSRMFIEPLKPVTVEELIQGMIVQSGNDACVALAEIIAGSEAQFAELMNQEAQRLGMKSSRFRNATGLPDPQHTTTVADLAILSLALIRDFPEFYAKYYSMKAFRYNNITQPNRNRLLWTDSSFDGLKTGFTEAAGYCLIASAKRGPRRLVSVVVGTASDQARAQESLRLMRYGFEQFEGMKLYDKGQVISQIRVFKGAENMVKAGFTGDFILSLPKGVGARLKADMLPDPRLVAPLAAGQRVGTLRLTVDGKPFGDYPVVALEAVAEAGFFGRMIDAVRLWINS